MGARAGALALAIALAACSAAPRPSSTATLSATPATVPTATAGPTPTGTPETLTPDALVALVDAPALMEHLEALQAVADANDGNRATGSAGFEASVDYVASALEAAGYVVERRAFDARGVPSANLIADRLGSSDDVIVVGAHLDSVVAGPGINDNGSGVAALLVIAEALAGLPAPRHTFRFAFWGAEEGGPFGSAAYVEALDSAERDRIVAYLSFDMLASPNAVRFVYDEAGAAPGSDRLTDLFAATMDTAGLAWEPIDLEGDSDHGPFSDAGIPTGGLFSGGIEPVTDAQAEAFGAVAGEPADPCSHRACDTIDNVDTGTLEEMARIIAGVLVELAVP